MTNLEISKTVKLSFDEAEKKIKASLKEQGFGILTEIVVDEVLKTKLNVTMEKYKILGACNPKLANQALTLDRRMGALLPCNVYLQTIEDGKTKVAAIDPDTMFSVINNPKMEDIIKEAKQGLTKAINDL